MKPALPLAAPLFAAAPLAALVLAAAAPASAALAADPAADRVDAFNHALLDTMKQGKSLGAQGRYRKLQPAVERAFDLPTMTRVAVGPSWSTLAPGDQEKLVTAFTRMSVATWAHNFDDYSGESFKLGAVSANASGDKLVRDQLVQKGGDPVTLNYRMRETPAGWKIVDVFYNGSISSIATQRSDFASTLSAGGAPALIRKLDAQSDTLLKGK